MRVNPPTSTTADAYEAFIRNVMLGIPTNPTFCQMLGFDALNPEVPKRADETGALVTGKADGIDLEKGLVSFFMCCLSRATTNMTTAVVVFSFDNFDAFITLPSAHSNEVS